MAKKWQLVEKIPELQEMHFFIRDLAKNLLYSKLNNKSKFIMSCSLLQ